MNLAELEAVENKKGFNKTQSSCSFIWGWDWSLAILASLCHWANGTEGSSHLGDLILIMKRKGLPLSPGGRGRTERQLTLGGNDTESWSAVQMAVKLQVCWIWKELTVAFSFILPWAWNVWPPVMQRLRDLCRNWKQEGHKDRFSSCLDLGETGLYQKCPHPLRKAAKAALHPHESSYLTPLGL